MRVPPIFRLAALAALLSLVAAACGPSAAPGAPTAAPTGAAGKPAGTASPVTLSFWHGMNGTEPGTQGGALKTLVDQYKQVAPNVTLTLDFTPYTGNELPQKVTAAIAANNTPDLVQAFESDVAAWYKAGAIVPLDEYIRQSLGADDLADIQAALLDSGKFPQYDNKQLSFPFNRSLYVLYFNKPELAKAGYPAGPRTWDDVAAACEKIAADGMLCYAVQPGPDAFIPIVWSRGGDVLSKDLKKATFNGPEGVEALSFDVNMIKSNRAYVSKGFDWQNEFGAGKVAMSPVTTIAGDPFIAKAVNNAFEIGIAPVPAAAGKPARSMFSGTNLAIMKSTPEKEQAAWDFVKWLTETKQTAYWTAQTNYLPIRKSALDEPSVKEYLAKTPRFQVALDQVPTAGTGPSVAGWADARIYLQEAVTAAVTLTAEPKAALDDAAGKADAALARE